jgi:hypothetical protein
MINTSPEPVTNWAASIMEDLAVVGGLWAALNYPLLFIGLLVLFLALAIWLLPKIWRAIERVVAKIRSWFRNGEQQPAVMSASPGKNEETPKLESPPPS